MNATVAIGEQAFFLHLIRRKSLGIRAVVRSQHTPLKVSPCNEPVVYHRFEPNRSASKFARSGQPRFAVFPRSTPSPLYRAAADT